LRDRWYHTLLIFLLLVQLLVLSTSEPARGSRAEVWLLRVVAPLGRGVAAASGLVRGAADAMRSNRSLQAENQQLRRALDETRRALVRRMTLEERGVGMARDPEAAGTDPHAPIVDPFFIADIVYFDPTAGLRTLVLDGGDHDPQRNQVVRAVNGLVGRIIVSAGRYGKVQLLTDRASAVSAMIERTRRKGLVRGGSNGGLELTLLPQRADVRAGDRVVTAGIDGVYPRGIPIGTIASVAPAPGLFLHIELQPAVDFGLLERVYVLRGAPVPKAILEAQADAPD